MDRAGFEPATFRLLGVILANRMFFGLLTLCRCYRAYRAELPAHLLVTDLLVLD